MAESDRSDEIVGYLVATAKAHHAATGGVNTHWAHWYAENLLDDLNRALRAEMDVGELETWLGLADSRYQSEPQTTSWPKAYAAWLRSDYE